MENSVLAYFLTFSTYGTRLHGRDTGSVDRDHNQFDTPLMDGNHRRAEFARSRMRKGEYLLDEQRRRSVLQAICDQANHRGWKLWAVHVRSDHVHVVISAAEISPERILVDLKAYSSRRLREVFDEDADRMRWTRHGSTRYLWDEQSLSSAIHYVLERQGESMSVFPVPVY